MEQKEEFYQVYTECDSLWSHIESEQLNCLFFPFFVFLKWRPGQLNNNFTPCPYFTSLLALSGESAQGGRQRLCSVIFLLPLWFVRVGHSCSRSCVRHCLIVLHLVHSAGAELIDPVGIHPVDPALVQVDEEHYVC